MEVYEPREDSILIKQHIREFAKGSVLDIGTGSGILAQEASDYAESVLAVDINPKAVSYCRKNSQGKNIRYIKSDLFSDVEGKFDLIIFNPPYLPQDKGIKDPALYGGKKGYEIIERFLRQVSDHLEDDGKILLLFSSLTKKNIVEKSIYENCLKFREIDKKTVFFETLFLYLVENTELKKELTKKGVTDVHYLAKGKRGVVYTGILDGKKVTIKSKNPRSEAIGRIKIEADWLVKLNKKGIGPKFIAQGDGFIIYHFVEGISLLDYVKSESKAKIMAVTLDILKQLRTLDGIGVDKEEMHRPTKNLLIAKNPVLIDFERCHATEHPKNVTQFCQFLVSKNFSALLASKSITIDKQKLLSLAKTYKHSGEQKDFKTIFGLIRSSFL